MKTETIKAIGLELADIRRSKDLSLVQVARSTNINKDTISKYENGNSSIKIYILDILITYYGTNIANFFTKVYDRLQNENTKNES
jgi:transcriptional regulator with XRE-family HTH domain